MILLLTALLQTAPLLHNELQQSETSNLSPISLLHSPPPKHTQTSLAQTELTLLEEFSLKKAKQAMELQTKALEAAQDHDPIVVQDLMLELEIFIKKFNKGLDTLPLKNSEVKSLQKKMQATNQLSLEILQQSRSDPPNQDKIIELQRKTMVLQQEVLNDTQKIKQQIANE